MTNKVVSMEKAAALIPDGATIMVGGFQGCGNPITLIEAILERDVKDLTLIASDSGKIGHGIARLIDERRVRKLITSHVGLNPNVQRQYDEGFLSVRLIPMGTLAECIHAGGAGLGGVLTPTGLETEMEEGKEIITVDGKPFLLERPLRADFALICGYWVERNGNVWYRGTTKNFNQIMAMAADCVICEADYVMDIGSIKPENVATPSVFVDYVVQGKGMREE